AGIGCRARIVAAASPVEKAQRQLVTAVIDVIKDRAIALSWVLWRQQVNVRLEFHLALGVLGRQRQIDDDLIAYILRINRKMCHTDDLLVWPHVAKRHPTRKRLAAEDLQLFEFGIANFGNEQEQAKYPTDARFHASPSKECLIP